MPDIHARVAGQGKAFTRLSGGLVKLLAGIEMRPLRRRIAGTAGSGKAVGDASSGLERHTRLIYGMGCHIVDV